ncbi:MAG: DinB family protein [Chloroflexota bacterium]|jgi:hypothetical protein
MNDEARKDQLKQRLTHQRQGLLDVLAGLSDEDWQTAVFPDDEEIDPPWTVADLVRHVADAELSMTRLMQLIREGGEGVPADFDLNRWNNSRLAKNRHKSPAEVTADMAQQRAALFQFIDSLTPADLEKAGRHGRGTIMTIDQICVLIAGHDKLHLADIKQAVGL